MSISAVDWTMAHTADEWRQLAARSSLRAFTARMFPGYQTSAHILALVDALEWAEQTPGARLIVDMPPRHSKSVHVSENLPAWFLGRNPDKRVIAASHTASLAYTFSRRVRNKIASDRYPFPGISVAGDKAAVQAWDIQGHQGGYLSVGVGGAPTGQGADLIVIDDPIKSAADAESETTRESIWEWYTGTLRTRLEPGGSIVLTATRWHEDDLTGRLLQAAEEGGEPWRHIHMAAIDDDGNALWPERWPVDALEKIKSAVGSRVWQAQYQGSPTPADGGLFKDWWWQRYTSLPKLVSLELCLDSAFKDGVANDYSVFALWGSDGRGSSYLVNVWRAKLQYPDLMRMAHTAHAWSRAQFPGIHISLVIEDKASGQSAIQTLKKPYPTVDGPTLPALPVVAFPVKASESKTARAEGITPIVEGGRAFIPQAAPWLADWLEEHQKFPNGKNDDQVDTSVIGLNRTQRARGGLA
jgi:predicted phage terminase large subunit-like protein